MDLGSSPKVRSKPLAEVSGGRSVGCLDLGVEFFAELPDEGIGHRLAGVDMPAGRSQTSGY